MLGIDPEDAAQYRRSTTAEMTVTLRHRSHKRPMHQLAAPLRRLSNAHSFNKCLLIQLVGKIASCPLIYRAVSASHLSGCPHRANRSIWLNHVEWE